MLVDNPWCKRPTVRGVKSEYVYGYDSAVIVTHLENIYFLSMNVCLLKAGVGVLTIIFPRAIH